MKIAEHRAWTCLSLFMWMKYASNGNKIYDVWSAQCNKRKKIRNWMKIYFCSMETNLAQMILNVSPSFVDVTLCWTYENETFYRGKPIYFWLINQKKSTKIKTWGGDIDKKTFIISSTDALPAETDARYGSEEKRHVRRYAKVADVKLGRRKSMDSISVIPPMMIDGFQLISGPSDVWRAQAANNSGYW